MSSLASNSWNQHRQATVSATSMHGNAGNTAVSTRISVVRDTLLVLGLQLVFRATLILRRWNY
jgi:hypothetical protein